MSRPIFLNGLDLQSGSFRIADSDIFNAPPKVVTVIELARKEGAKAVFERFGSRKINLTGYIQDTTSNIADASLDELKAFVGRRSLELKVEFNGAFRIWTVNAENLQVARKNTDVSRMGFNLQLVAPNPFGADESTTTLVDESGITDDINIPLTGGGTFFAQPLITITINSINPDDSDVTLSVGNASENTYMDITNTFVAGDVITIDSFNEIIYKNSTIIEGDGLFPIWSPTGGTLEVTHSASTIDVDILATYYRRWL